jgi:protein involved in polysaccharide export with SLBB domain
MSMMNVGKGLRHWAMICGLVFGGLCLSACRTQPSGQQFAELPPGVVATTPASSAPAAAKPAPTSPASEATLVAGPAAAPVGASAASSVTGPVGTNRAGPEPEVLRVGDSLTVTFTDTPTTIPPFQDKIKEDGTITLTLNQTFKADGKTRGALEKEIRARYVPDYYKYLTVTVTPDVNTRWYYIEGEVRQPSRQIYTSRITVLKAIASAGGFTDFANKKKVKLTRVDGRSYTVNCVKALDNPALDLEIYPGDKIHVPRRLW